MASVVVESAIPHRVLEASPAFLELFGYVEAQVAGRSVRMLHGPGTDGRGLVDIIARAVTDKVPQRTLAALYSSDASPVLVSVAAGHKGDDGRCVIDMHCSGAIALKEALMDDGKCKMLLSAETQRIEDVSMAFASRYGLSVQAAHGRSVSIIQGPGSDVLALRAMLATARGGLVQRGKILTYCSDCTETPAMLTVIPVHDGKGRVSHFMIALEAESSTQPRSLNCVLAPGSARSLPYSSGSFWSSLAVPQTHSWQGSLMIALLVLALPGLLRMPIIASGHAGVGAGHALSRALHEASRVIGSHKSTSLYAHRANPCATGAEPSLVLQDKHIKGDKLTLMLDLDKTVLYGNDGNDLGVALQWMDKDFSTVQELYKQLINPSLRKVYEFYVQQGKQVEVVIYTRRPQIVYYKSCVRQNTVPVRYAEDWHDQGQIYFPSHVKTSEDIVATYAGPELVDDEMHDVKMSLDRLLAARNAVAHELGLSSMPPVVVTAEAKDTEATAQYFNVPVESCLLFDDNSELRSDPRVVLVEPFESLPTERRRRLLDFMQRELPAEKLEEDLIEYLEEARANEMSIKRNPNNKLVWWIPEAKGEVRSWRTPEFLPARSASCHVLPAGAKILRSDAQKTDPFSNVSPADMPLRIPGSGLIDLRAAAEKAALMRDQDLADSQAARNQRSASFDDLLLQGLPPARLALSLQTR
jgi:hypothetical protein